MEESKTDKPKHAKLPRAYSIKDLNNIIYQVFSFLGEWKELFGSPEIGVSWFIWGNSGNGKSTACAKLAYMLSGLTKVLYLSLEEKKGKSLRSKLKEVGFTNDSKNFGLLPFTTYTDLIARLRKRNSENVIFIDSLQYWRISYAQYINLIETFPNKTFIFVSHAKGKDPKGTVADAIHYDAGVKIWVEGGMMDVKHRFEGGGGQMIVVPELAKRYWNKTSGVETNKETEQMLELALGYIQGIGKHNVFMQYLKDQGINITS